MSCQALRFVSDLLDAFDPAPVPVALQPVEHYLVERLYDPQAIRLALRDLAMWGTAQFTKYIDDEDRAQVEGLLPPAPAAAWEAHEGWRWAADRDDETIVSRGERQ